MTNAPAARQAHAQLLATGFLLFAVALFGPRVARATPDAAACIKVRPEARYRALGYNHIVHLTNVCKATAECDVTTDVNPQPTHATVPAGEHVEVNTFLGSPSREFTPKVECKLAQ